MQIKSIQPIHEANKMQLPLLSASVSAGFPSPAENYVDRKIDLNQELIKNPAATFFVRVEGDSMQDAGIFSGDILIVDRSLSPKEGKIVVAVVNGEFTVKKIMRVKGKLFLVPENKKYPPIEITPEMDFMVWGVVSHAIHSF